MKSVSSSTIVHPRDGTHSSPAYVLNLRGQDIPFNPVFHSYLLITLDKAILFIAEGKVGQDVEDYLKNVGVRTEKYDEIWRYLRSRELTNVSFSLPSCFARS